MKRVPEIDISKIVANITPLKGIGHSRHGHQNEIWQCATWNAIANSPRWRVIALGDTCESMRFFGLNCACAFRKGAGLAE